jgi:multidrug efflux pump subunit AcrB
MLFLGIVLLGLIGWFRIPVELMPALSGDQLYVRFFRPGSEPEVVEREILLRLEARIQELPGVEETWAQVRGSMGSFRIRFEPGTDLKVRELEMQRLAADLVRDQPRGTSITVSARDLEAMSRFVMLIQVVGGEDRNSLRDVVDERVLPRIAALGGVSQVMASGGASRELTVWIDTDKCAAAGVTTREITEVVTRTVQRLRYLGGVEDEAGRTTLMLDGRPGGVSSIGDIRIAADRPVMLRHVAAVEMGAGREEYMFRVNGKPSVGLVIFQEEGANLVSLGRQLRRRLDELRDEFRPYGIDFVVGFDAADTVEEQLDRLKKLALTGFGVALLVLFLFLREIRAVAVVAVAVPVSLLAAVAMLFVGGWTLNLITLFGLAVGIGMLVDNSIVVYEAVQRRLERGADADLAAEDGIRNTVRAILAASVTNAVVFLPVAMAVEDTLVRNVLKLIAVAILLPLAASLLGGSCFRGCSR